MADKITPQEVCPFCGSQPCQCATVDKRKAHRSAILPSTHTFKKADCPYCHGVEPEGQTECGFCDG